MCHLIDMFLFCITSVYCLALNNLAFENSSRDMVVLTSDAGSYLLQKILVICPLFVQSHEIRSF
jgi:hypothetical protein